MQSALLVEGESESVGVAMESVEQPREGETENNTNEECQNDRPRCPSTSSSAEWFSAEGKTRKVPTLAHSLNNTHIPHVDTYVIDESGCFFVNWSGVKGINFHPKNQSISVSSH